MMIREYWLSHATDADPDYPIVPKVKCADGFSMSVQASQFHYCSPRITDLSCPYTQWEVGFPSEREDTLMEYIDGDPKTTDPLQTVYGYVPTDVINVIIEKHGGLET